MTDLEETDGGETVFTEAWPTGQAEEDHVDIPTVSLVCRLGDSDEARSPVKVLLTNRSFFVFSRRIFLHKMQALRALRESEQGSILEEGSWQERMVSDLSSTVARDPCSCFIPLQELTFVLGRSHNAAPNWRFGQRPDELSCSTHSKSQSVFPTWPFTSHLEISFLVRHYFLIGFRTERWIDTRATEDVPFCQSQRYGKIARTFAWVEQLDSHNRLISIVRCKLMGMVDATSRLPGQPQES